MATGNTVVLKPSPHTPCSAMETAIAVSESDIPPGVFNVLPGGGVDAGEALVANGRVGRRAFTGSSEAGRRIGQLAPPPRQRGNLQAGGNRTRHSREAAYL